MADLQPVVSGSWRKSAESSPPLSPARPDAVGYSDSFGAIAALRQDLSAGTESAAAIFHATVEAARLLTSASGVALALRTNGTIVCRERSGEIAPPPGIPLNLDSGISGECLRTATIMICNDATIDSRVDREACLALGVRSIAALPLRGSVGICGILEAFSDRADAFGNEAIDTLRALAEIAESAYDRECRERDSPRSSSKSRRALPSLAVARDRNQGASAWSGMKRRVWIVGVGAIALLLVSGVVWLSVRNPIPELAASEAAAHRLTSEATLPDSRPHATLVEPQPRTGGRPSERAHDVLHNAADIHGAGEQAPAAFGNDRTEGESTGNPVPQNISNDATPADSAGDPAPTVELNGSENPRMLGALKTSSAPLPSLEAKVSQGVTPAVLVQKVNPVYPPQARSQGITGSVTLEATVAKDGSVSAVRVIDGDPLLASAATAAVRRWRYRPTLLNGQPVEVQTKITFVFRYP